MIKDNVRIQNALGLFERLLCCQARPKLLADCVHSHDGSYASLSRIQLCAPSHPNIFELFLIFKIPMLYFGIPVLALAYGGTYNMAPQLTSIYFGVKYYGANFGAISAISRHLWHLHVHLFSCCSRLGQYLAEHAPCWTVGGPFCRSLLFLLTS